MERRLIFGNLYFSLLDAIAKVVGFFETYFGEPGVQRVSRTEAAFVEKRV